MITVHIDDHEFRRRVKGLLESLDSTHLSRVLDRIGQNLIERTRSNIKAGHDWQDREFAENRPVTLSRKDRTDPLIASGIWLSTRLYHQVSGSVLTLGAGGEQAGVLHFGASKGQFGRGRTRNFPIPWGDIPARPYMPITDDGTDLAPAARREIFTSITEYLDSVGGK